MPFHKSHNHIRANFDNKKRFADNTTINFLMIAYSLIKMQNKLCGEVTQDDVETIQRDALEIAQEMESSEIIMPNIKITVHQIMNGIKPTIKAKTTTRIISERRINLLRNNVRDCYNKSKSANPVKIEMLYGDHVSELIEQVELLIEMKKKRDDLITKMNRELSKFRLKNSELEESIKLFNESVLSTFKKYDKVHHE